MKERMYQNMIKSLVKEEDKNRYSYLIIVVDKYYEYKKIFVERSTDIKDIIFNIICDSKNQIKEVYNYDMDLKMQIDEDRAYHLVKDYDKMKEAYEFAKEKHNNQTRLDGEPYINHPVKVAELVNNNFNNSPIIKELITASYLHDVVEDTNTRVEEIKDRFGQFVADIVLELTNDSKLKEEYGKTNYLCYKLKNISDNALDIKLCDRLANVLDLKNAPSDFSNYYMEETLTIINYLQHSRKLSNSQCKLIETINKELYNLKELKIKVLERN